MQYNASMKALVPPHKAGEDASARHTWRVDLDGGASCEADSVVLASGGLSFPAVGTDGTGHNVAETVRACSLRRLRTCRLSHTFACSQVPHPVFSELPPCSANVSRVTIRRMPDVCKHSAVQLGHSLNAMYPALTPLIGSHPSGSPIPGVSLDVHAEVHTGKRRRRAAPRTGFLFTHRGTPCLKRPA